MQDFFIARAGKTPLHADSEAKTGRLNLRKAAPSALGQGEARGWWSRTFPHTGEEEIEQREEEKKKGEFLGGVQAPWSEVNSDAVPLPQELR